MRVKINYGEVIFGVFTSSLQKLDKLGCFGPMELIILAGSTGAPGQLNDAKM